MIKVDFFVAVAAYLFLTTILVILRWIFYTCVNNSQDDLIQPLAHLVQCPYCAYLFFDYEQTSLKVCPRCESYITADMTLEKSIPR